MLTAPTERNSNVRVMVVVWPRKEGQENATREVRGNVADEVMYGAVELGLQIYEAERDAEKVDRVASPS